MATKYGILGGLLGLVFLTSTLFWLSQDTAAPEVTFKTIKGESIQLGELKGHVVLVTFWATDCPGCIEEIPHLVQLYGKHHQQGLEIMAIAMHYDPPNRVKTLAEDRKLPYAIALDLDSNLAKAFGNVQLTPTSFVIDKKGAVRQQKVGVFDLNKLDETLTKLLGEIR